MDMEEQHDGSLSVLRTLLLGYVIGAAMTFSQVMPSERSLDVVSQTLIIARSMAISLTWPLYWGWRLYDS